MPRASTRGAACAAATRRRTWCASRSRTAPSYLGSRSGTAATKEGVARWLRRLRGGMMIRFRLRFLPMSTVQKTETTPSARPAQARGSRTGRRAAATPSPPPPPSPRRPPPPPPPQRRASPASAASRTPTAFRRRNAPRASPSAAKRFRASTPRPASAVAVRLHQPEHVLRRRPPPRGVRRHVPRRGDAGLPPSLPGLIEQLVPVRGNALSVRVIPARAWSAALRRRHVLVGGARGVRSRCPGRRLVGPRRRLGDPRRLRRLLERVVRDEQPRRDARLAALRAARRLRRALRRGGGGGLGALFGSFRRPRARQGRPPGLDSAKSLAFELVLRAREETSSSSSRADDVIFLGGFDFMNEAVVGFSARRRRGRLPPRVRFTGSTPPRASSRPAPRPTGRSGFRGARPPAGRPRVHQFDVVHVLLDQLGHRHLHVGTRPLRWRLAARARRAAASPPATPRRRRPPTARSCPPRRTTRRAGRSAGRTRTRTPRGRRR